MGYRLSIEQREFRFRFEARTSRGPMPRRDVWLLRLTDTATDREGWGEAAPLTGLSQESEEETRLTLEGLVSKVASMDHRPEDFESWWRFLNPHAWPSSVRMAMEMAVRDLCSGGERKVFDSPFFDGQPIPINGLIWMGSPEFMWSQVLEKISAGFTCLKLKVGGLRFEDEIELLAAIRRHPEGRSLTLRLDANGAFDPSDALLKLERLTPFDIHSLEQPIRAGRVESMAHVCRNSPIPIALDEELIGRFAMDEKVRLLEETGARYLVLKPGLHGGFGETREWISVAESLGQGWWITSALESPVGLNAIAQFTSTFGPTLPQGLGTGHIYEGTFQSPLVVENGRIRYEKRLSWDF